MARLLGGVSHDMLLDAPVIFHATGERPARRHAPGVRGRIARVLPVGPKPPGARRPEVRVVIDAEGPVAADAFGHFDFPGCDFRGDVLHSKALDNVLSCVLIVSTLARLRRRRAAANVLGVFTRAEEVGFVGAGGVLRSRVLAPSRPLVVLECSKARGDVMIGGGPVLRVGDRMTAFDPEMDLWSSDRAAQLAQGTSDFRYQRALMTGGACEASLYMLHGRKTGAIAIPLGNYHNMTDDGRIGAEFIHVRDFEDALRLLTDLCSNPPSASIVRARRAELDRVFAHARARLAAD
jgi:endoglucanase